MEQPNVTGDGDVPLTLKFWLAVVATGVAAGLFGDLMMFVLFSVEHLAFGYHAGPLEAATERASDLRRVLALMVGGLVTGLAWYVVRRLTRGEHSDADDAIWRGDGTLSFRRSFATGLISEVAVGAGASLGREAAPKLMGGVAGSLLGRWGGFNVSQRRLLVACGTGAGLAAVYNVPLGGALFTAELMVGSVTLPVVLPALACSYLATLTAWLYLPIHPTYVSIPAYHFTATILVWALLVGPAVGVLATGYLRLIGTVAFHRARGLPAALAPLVGFTILGLIGFAYPQLFGNGKDIAHDAFVGHGALLLFVAVFFLKPVVTALCLGTGASGGLFTPTLSTGAAFGAALGMAWSLAWPGSPAGAYAMVGAAAMLGASMQAPLASLALVLELTHSGFSILVPMLAATATATAVARKLDGYSIYSARLPPHED
jgi:CIC family chloride channel protein